MTLCLLIFRYPYFIARSLLAGIDHNFNNNRVYAKTKNGAVVYMRKYNKRTKSWHAQPVKKMKEYPYLLPLLAKSLLQRVADEESSSRSNEGLATDPKRIAPTIAGSQVPPATEALIKERKSRFAV